MSENKQLKVETKNVFGTLRVYPLCTTGKLLAGLAGTKSFTPKQIEYLKALGYELHQEALKL